MAECQMALREADIVIANLLFLEEHVAPILPDLIAARDARDAFVGIIADGQIVKLTKMGDLDMGKPASAAMQLLKSLRGSKQPSSASGEKQMKMLRRLPKILRFIPGKAQDLRAWFLCMQYWLGGSDDNIEQMMRFLVSRYATRADWRRATAKAPVDYPDVGLYHPALPQRITTDPADLPRPAGAKATVGLLILRSLRAGRRPRALRRRDLRLSRRRGWQSFPPSPAVSTGVPRWTPSFRGRTGPRSMRSSR